jgi:hypothetical protein
VHGAPARARRRPRPHHRRGVRLSPPGLRTLNLPPRQAGRAPARRPYARTSSRRIGGRSRLVEGNGEA